MEIYPFTVVASGVFRRVWACRSVSQLPTRMPMDLALYASDAGGQLGRE